MQLINEIAKIHKTTRLMAPCVVHYDNAPANPKFGFDFYTLNIISTMDYIGNLNGIWVLEAKY